ncbi:MAG: serine/threonine protein kinase [Cyanobacteria bacterium]|nr:serine/threonine protein kinase [Cyanobacteriota bacterium]
MADEDLQEINERERQHLQSICLTCGKPISTLQEGSLTAWIFGDINCSCNESDITESQQQLLALQAPSTEYATTGMDLPERYQFLELIGRGGMAAVFKCRDKADGKNVAIKVLRPELAVDKAAVKRFEQEATSALNLNHRNLVKLYSYGNAPSGAPYLVMEFVEGKSLSMILSEVRRLSPERLLPIIAQICQALSHAHKKGVVHRDLKPSNIIISRDENGEDMVHLVDFGIAKVLSRPGETMTELTQSGELIGSPLYMSPEQCEGENLDGRSDIYSLGCVMYQCITGRPPFGGKNVVKIILSHIRETHDEIEDNSVPQSLKDIIDACLKKQADERYQRVEDLQSDIEEVMRGARPKRASSGAQLNREPGRRFKQLEEATAPKKQKSSSSSGSMVLISIVATVIIGGAIAYFANPGLFSSVAPANVAEGVVAFYQPPAAGRAGVVVIKPLSPLQSTAAKGFSLVIADPGSVDPSHAGIGEYWRAQFKRDNGMDILTSVEVKQSETGDDLRQITVAIMSMFSAISGEKSITTKDMMSYYTHDWSAGGYARFKNTWRGVKFKSGARGKVLPSFFKVEFLDHPQHIASIRVKTDAWVKGNPAYVRIQAVKEGQNWKISQVDPLSESEWQKPISD